MIARAIRKMIGHQAMRVRRFIGFEGLLVSLATASRPAYWNGPARVLRRALHADAVGAPACVHATSRIGASLAPITWIETGCRRSRSRHRVHVDEWAVAARCTKGDKPEVCDRDEDDRERAGYSPLAE